MNVVRRPMLGALLLASAAHADRQVIAPGTGLQSAVEVDSGANGICETKARGDDLQAAKLGQGAPFEDERAGRQTRQGELRGDAPARGRDLGVAADPLPLHGEGVKRRSRRLRPRAPPQRAAHSPLAPSSRDRQSRKTAGDTRARHVFVRPAPWLVS